MCFAQFNEGPGGSDKSIKTLWPKIDETLKKYPLQYRKRFRKGIEESVREIEKVKRLLEKMEGSV